MIYTGVVLPSFSTPKSTNNELSIIAKRENGVPKQKRYPSAPDPKKGTTRGLEPRQASKQASKNKQNSKQHKAEDARNETTGTSTKS